MGNLLNRKIEIFPKGGGIRNFLTFLNIVLLLWILYCCVYFVSIIGLKDFGTLGWMLFYGEVYLFLALFNWLIFIINLIKFKRVNLFQRIVFYVSIIFALCYMLMFYSLILR
jgi:hypothetical protein